MNQDPQGTAGGLSKPEEMEMANTADDGFVAEFHRMDLSKLFDKTFLVAVNKGDRNKGLFLCNTVKGPYDFVGMVEAAGRMHKEHLHHAKVVILDKEANKGVRFLDAGTIDYIEANATDIIFDATIGAAILEPTCVAGVIEDDEKIPESKE